MSTDIPREYDRLRSVATGLTQPGPLRAGDADREATATRIRRAYVEASLTLEEFDTRTAAAWAATTRAELAALTADLPAPATPLPVTPITPTLPRPRGNKGRKALHILTMIWLTLSLVDFAVWALVCIGSLSWIYPWWIWVFVPAGTALFTISRFVNQPRS
jgi:hypothetical protein